MRQQATDNRSPDDILEAIDKLIRLSKTPQEKEQLYNQYKKYGDSLRFARDTSKNRFALIRYDVQKSKADNLLYQQQILRQQILIYSVSALALVFIIAIYTWYTRRKKRIQQESEDAIRNAHLKTSQKVHDVVANGLYGIMNELEHKNVIEREPLLVKIEDLYEKSRNISYEDIPSVIPANYDTQVHDLLTTFASEQTRVFIIGNQPSFWNLVNTHQKQQLQLTLNEIMINMKKHSKATQVVVQFKQEGDIAIIHYKDNGLGFPTEEKLGNGLKNTVNRIKSINGAIIFEKSGKTGASIAINFPLSSATL